MWIKICGNTSLRDAELAIEAGANALGFIFAPSPRQLTAAAARAITAQLPPQIESYGVFVQPTFEEVLITVEEAGLTGVQLHATGDRSLALRLREHYSALSERDGRRRLGLLRVLHLPAVGNSGRTGSHEGEPGGSGALALDENIAELGSDHAADAVLIDSRIAGSEGGTGLRFDWAMASGSFLRAAPHLRLIAAGGLSPENVAEAVATLRPWGIDVVTGVESEPGRKDPAKLRAFIERTRAAARALAQPAPLRA